MWGEGAIRDAPTAPQVYEVKHGKGIFVTKDALPAGLMQTLKMASRALIAAAATQGATGPQRVAEITGYSPGIISRWQSDAYRDVMPLEVVALLEFLTQAPVFGRALASLTSNRLVPLGESDEASDMVGELIRVTGSGSMVSAELGLALRDGEVTPAEAKAIMGAVGAHEDVLASVKRKLANVRPKGEG